jgi:excisionase family DNA binding protein
VLDELGIRGNPQREFVCERVLATPDSIKRRGAEWHAAQLGSGVVSAETTPVSAPGYSEVMNDDTMTTAEAAEQLGCTTQNVCKLVRRGGLRGHKSPDTGAWVLDRAAVEARA